jgi:hypothetical protein
MPGRFSPGFKTRKSYDIVIMTPTSTRANYRAIFFRIRREWNIAYRKPFDTKI